MATIQDFILRFKTEGEGKLKSISGTIENLANDVSGLGNQFGALGNTLGGVTGKLGPLGVAFTATLGAMAALGLKATQIAGEITDISNATGISAGSLLNFKQSIIEAGGSVDSFSKFAAKLSTSIGEANAGNENYQKSFKQLGVTVRDANGQLRPTESILQDVLGSLKNIQDPAARTAAAVALLGKEAARIDWSNVKAGRDAITDKQIADLDKYNDLIDKVRASLERKVITFFGSVAEQVIEASNAIDRYNKKLEDRETELNKQGRTSRQFSPGGPSVTMNNPAGGNIGIRKLTAEEQAYIERQAQVNQTIEQGAADHAREMKRLRSLGQQGDDYGGRSEAGIKAAQDSARRAQQSILEAEKNATFIGLAEIGRVRLAAEKDIDKEILNIRSQDKLTPNEQDIEIAAKRKEILSRTALQIANITEQQNKQVQSLSLVTREFENQALLAQSKLDLETELVGKSQEEAQIRRAQRDLFLDYRNQFETLEKRRASLGKDEKYLNDVIIQQQDAIYQSYLKQDQQLVKSITNNQAALAIEKERAAQLDRMVMAYEQQQRLQQSQGDLQRKLISDQQAVQFEGQQQTRSPYEKQIALVKENARRAGLEAGRTFAQLFEDSGDGLTAENAKKLADGLALIEVGYANIVKQQLANLESSRTFSAGWSDAYKKYADDARTASDQAKTYFDTFSSGFEDAIVRFVQTGKLSFKDLANSIIADFARIQAKKLLVGLFDSGTGGLFGGIGKIFGFANGGNPAMGKPILVGEQGPELMIPRNATTIVPNNQLGGGNQTVVTYNINATDAQSFQQLLARDPSFLYAVSEKGRRSLPQGAMR